MAQPDARVAQHLGRRGPGRVQPAVAEPGQFRHPAPDIAAVLVELLALGDRVEDAEVGRGVGPRSRHPLPVLGVRGLIRVDQRVPEPGLALAPIDQQVLDQEAGDDHPHAVVHPAGRPELAHARIDDGIAGPPPFPGLQRRGVPAPGHGVVLWPEGRVRDLLKLRQQVSRELAPADLGDELVGLDLADFALGRRVTGGRDRAPGADLAPVQMRRQATGPVLAGKVPETGVVGERAASEAFERLSRALFARGPVETRGPVRARGMQTPAVQVFASHLGGGLELARSQRMRRCFGVGHEGPEEGREHLVWSA